MLHKRAGLKFLRYMFRSNDKKVRNWYKGYHSFRNKHDVLNRFNEGKPLSCFVIDGDTSQVHVAYTHCDRDYDITYATFTCSTSVLHKKEVGMHFCRFECINELTSARKQDLNITDVALMLPYIHTGDDIRFQKQFTLIYSDWEVLRCDLPTIRKGTASTNNRLFAEVIEETGC